LCWWGVCAALLFLNSWPLLPPPPPPGAKGAERKERGGGGGGGRGEYDNATLLSSPRETFQG